MATTNTVFALFDSADAAKKAYNELVAAGVPAANVALLGKGDVASLQALKASWDDDDVDFYIESLNRGGTIVSADIPAASMDKAGAILAKYGMVDVDERVVQLKAAGANVNVRAAAADDYVLPVIEETMDVGKRQVERGKVRIYNKVTAREVLKDIGLRDETIRVQRTAVGRELSADEAAKLFTERSFELTEIDEEAVVTKAARVVEEVRLSKDVAERIETVKETLRRSDVEVQEIKAAAVKAFADYDADFQSYYKTNLASSKLSYAQWTPVFQYGYNLARSDKYAGQPWSVAAADAQAMWEKQNPGTWDTYKGAIQYAYEKSLGLAK